MSDKAIGFFGSYEGMTDAQLSTVERLLEEWAPTVVHHRSSIGADAQFDVLAAKRGVRREAHPSLAKRYHTKIACELVHETDSPAEARENVQQASHICIIALDVGSESSVRSNSRCYPKSTHEVLADGRVEQYCPSALFLAPPRTPIENANVIAQEFSKPEQISTQIVGLCTQALGSKTGNQTLGRHEAWRVLLERASPLYYARLVEAAMLQVERINELARQGTDLNEAKVHAVRDPIEDRSELAEAIWTARHMARQMETDRNARVYEAVPAAVLAQYPGRFSPNSFSLDTTMQWILREQYGVHWFTRREMNPFAPYWFYETVEELEAMRPSDLVSEPRETQIHYE